MLLLKVTQFSKWRKCYEGFLLFKYIFFFQSANIETLDKAAIETAKSLAKNCKCFLFNKNLCNTKNFKMVNMNRLA